MYGTNMSPFPATIIQVYKQAKPFFVGLQLIRHKSTFCTEMQNGSCCLFFYIFPLMEKSNLYIRSPCPKYIGEQICIKLKVFATEV